MFSGINLVTVVPLVVSSVVAAVGAWMTVQNRRDNRQAAQTKERIDTLTIGQQWVVDALRMSNEDNIRLRAKIAELEQAISRCTDECAAIKRELVERKR